VSRVLFSGYYGLGNAGDEAVLAGGIELLRRQRTDVEIAVLSQDPAATRALHGVEAFPRMQLSALRAALRGCDLLLSGGGSLLQYATSRRSLYYYLFVLWQAQRLGRRTMVFAQGMGPLQGRLSRRMTAAILRRTDAITVRDRDSADLLRALGVISPAPVLSADPAFALTPERTPRVEALLADLPRPRLAVAPRPCPGDLPALNEVIEALRARKPGLSVLAWALYPAQDEPLCRRLLSELGGGALASGLTPREWMALAAECDVVLGTRLHALIFAAAQGAPFLGLDYDPKVGAFLREAGGINLGPPGDLVATTLTTALEAALSGGAGEGSPEGWRDRAALSARMAVELLD